MHPSDLGTCSNDETEATRPRSGHQETSDLFLVIDSSGEIQMANVDSGCFLPEALGESLVGRSVFDLVDPGDHRALRNIIVDCLDRGRDYSLRVFARGNGGEVNLWLNPLQGRKKGLCAAVLSPLDPDAQGVQDFMGFVREGLDELGHPIMITDPEGRILFVNEAIAERLGASKEEMVGRMLPEIIDLSRVTRDDFISLYRAVMDDGSVEAALPLLSDDRDPFCMSSRLISLTYGGEDDKIVIVFGGERCSEMDGGEEKAGMPFLVRSSLEMVDAIDPMAAVQEVLDRLVEAEDMEFAIFRLVDPDKEPLVLCSNIGFKEAREILSSGAFDETLCGSGKGDHVMMKWDHPLPSIPGLGGGTLLAIRLGQFDRLHGIAVFGLGEEGFRMEAKLPMLRVFCNQAAVSVRHGRLARTLARRNTELRSLYDVTMALSTTLDVEKTLEMVLQKAVDLVAADNAFLFRLIDGEKLVCSRHICEYSDIVDGAELKLGEGITGLVAARGEGMLVERADQDERSIHVSGTPDGFSSLISVPIRVCEEVFGVITLEKESGTPFTRREFQIIEMFSVAAAVSIKNATMYERLERYASEYRLYMDLLTHDVANYNVPIHGFLEMLMTDPKLDERQRAYVRKALLQSDSISSLINNVRRLTELSMEGEGRSRKPVDIIPIISRGIREVYLNTLNSEMSIFYNPQIDTAFVMADDLVDGIFFNLLANASRFGGGQVSIVISPYEERGLYFWKVDFVDRGKGIPDDRKARIFDRFWEMDSDRRSEGHGLGLSVVRALCRRYGGRAWVEDRVKGDHSQGSVFSIILPRAKNS